MHGLGAQAVITERALPGRRSFGAISTMVAVSYTYLSGLVLFVRNI